MHALADDTPLLAARSRRDADWPRWVVPALLLVAAFAIRGWQIGRPFLHVDEDFYLFVGDRMLHGALPYVDIWDRKPVGLFLLFAAIRLLGGDGIVAYQIVATLFAGATAAVIARIAARYAAPGATLVAGLLYLALLGLNAGMGGQAPVFYNLFVAIAALLTIEAATGVADTARIRRLGLGAMALCGVAMQIKYSAVFEGMFFGATLMLAAYRAGRGVPGIAIDALAWIAVAVAPTLAAWAYYVAIGQSDAFFYANFVSILQRPSEGAAILLGRLGRLTKIFVLPLVCVVSSAWLRPLRPGPTAAASYRLVLAWMGAAFAGYFVFGAYFDHYALPLAGSTVAAAAPLFGVRRQRVGVLAAILLLIPAAIGYVSQVRSNLRATGGAAALETQVAAIRPWLAKGCVWIYRGDALPYYETGSCLLSRYAFPGHLWSKREAPAIGIDPLAEIRRVLALHPPVIVDTRLRRPVDVRPEADALVNAALARHYRLLVATGAPRSATQVYVRRD